MNIARDMKMVLFCLALFGTLPVFAAEPGDIPEATARLLTSGDPQLVKFGEQSLRVEQLNSPKAKARLEAELSRYLTFKERGLPLFEALSAGVLDDAQGEQLRNLILETTPPEPPIYGATTLPYQNLAAAQRLPVEEPELTPAYAGGSTTVLDADRQAGPTAPISQAIVNKARELNWSPASIYDYVYNYVEVEWYHGCMKGAEETLNQGSGNDCDQAALLVSLLRASGYPARFVVGVGLFLDWERVPTLLGVSDVAQVPTLLRRAGIPYVEERAGGKLANIRFEHVWVEAYVPYTNYRGSVADEGGELWLPLDTSLKAAGHVLSQPPELPEGLDLATVADNYLQADRPETPLEFLKTEIEVALDAVGSELAYEDLQQSCTLKSQHLDILPAGLPFAPVLVTGESASVPERLLHRVSLKVFDALDPNRVFCELDLPAFKLSNRSIAVRYEPETVEDQEIINSYGGLGQTPAYLVRLRPVITVDGERLAVGAEGLPMGEEARLSVELISPAGQKSFINELVVGNLTVMALVSGKPVLGETKALENKGAEEIYFDEGLRYLARWQAAERELASLLRLKLLHPAPQVVTLGGVIEVTRLLGSPQEFTWKGAFVDADLRQVELVGALNNRYRFMELSGLQGSVLEDRVLREDLGVDSISTARFLALANNQGIPLVTLNSGNVDTLLPGLPFGAKVKQDIADAVQQGQEVMVTESMLTLDAWTGVGYLRRDPVTGEAGWMLSGSIAGATFVVGPEGIPEFLREILRQALLDPPNDDPASIAYIYPYPPAPVNGTVGEEMEISARAVDGKGRPVVDAEIRFEISQGGGQFVGADSSITDRNGVATLSLRPGTNTFASPYLLDMAGKMERQQVGLNTVNCNASNGIRSQFPIQVLAFPDMSNKRLEAKTIFNRFVYNDICAAIHVQVLDLYDNPISNEDILYFFDEPLFPSGGTCPSDEAGGALLPQLVENNDPCLTGLLDRSTCQPVPTTDLTSVEALEYIVINGNCTSAEYPLDIITNDDTVTLKFYSFHPANLYDEAFLVMRFDDVSYENGVASIAAPADTSVALNATVYAQAANVYNAEQVISCENGSATCITTHMDNLSPVNRCDFEEPTDIRFNDVYAIQDELYPCKFYADYQVAPGVNVVDLSGYATLTIEDVLTGGGCVDGAPVCPTDSHDLTFTTVEDPGTSGLWRTIYLYGVQVTYDKPQYFVYTDEYGKSTHDLEIGIAVAPPDYVPEGAQFVLYEQKSGSTEQVPVRYIPLAAHAPDRQLDVNEDGIVDANVFAVTIPQLTRFEPGSAYFFDAVFSQGDEYQFKSDRREISVYSADLDLMAFRPGTIEVPGEQLLEFEEENPESLVLYVNSNKQPLTGVKDFDDDIIEDNDSDIVKLVLRRFDDQMLERGRISFTIEPEELFKVYNECGDRLDVSALSDLLTGSDPMLNILEHDVTFYIESLGPVYGAVAEIKLVDEWGTTAASDEVQLTSVFHTEDLHEAIAESARQAYKCIDPPGEKDDNLCNVFKSKWEFERREGFVSGVYSSSPFWENKTETVVDSLGVERRGTFIGLQKGKNASDAIMDIFNNPDRYRFECYNAVQVIHHRAVLSLMRRCNLHGDYLCRFDGMDEGSDGAFNDIFRDKVLAFAANYTNKISGYMGLSYKMSDKEYFTRGSWVYLRNHNEKLYSIGHACQGENLVQVDAKVCDICSAALGTFIFHDTEYCKYEPKMDEGLENPSMCIQDGHFFGHPFGRSTVRSIVKQLEECSELFPRQTDNEPAFGVKNREDVIDMMIVNRAIFKYDRGL